jgi:hypothetical protein
MRNRGRQNNRQNGLGNDLKKAIRIEQLPHKHEALNSNPSTTKEKKCMLTENLYTMYKNRIK